MLPDPLGICLCMPVANIALSSTVVFLRFDFTKLKRLVKQWKKVMWSDESRFTPFQSDGCRREADEVMHPSCSAMIWGCCSRSGLGSATLCAQKWGQLTTWIYWMTRLFHQWIFSALMAQAYTKMTMPGFIGSNCERVVQEAWDIIFTHGLSTTESRP